MMNTESETAVVNVTYASREHARQAIQKLNGYQFENNALRVSYIPDENSETDGGQRGPENGRRGYGPRGGTSRGVPELGDVQQASARRHPPEAAGAHAVRRSHHRQGGDHHPQHHQGDAEQVSAPPIRTPTHLEIYK
ncbi:hypothetical protein JOQ06_010364 [Pogonophryne albipinna]|uniref:RRM domain-containing protein n=1 Tax=Pogonophryne albipinna TaxID=1090488 RepID=A0AAD6FEK5_9TELE|nr:hypothetical protein JOQ06_010364 [Pogonophryne albipinna]